MKYSTSLMLDFIIAIIQMAIAISQLRSVGIKGDKSAVCTSFPLKLAE